ncbi:MAG: DNA topoisomerase IV subunit B [Deltaproteobacteria bacterium]|nr:DNA topoisomerase IV subunit B [Deltaproteobacteria bacterium]HCH66569.1 DNA topoisomerase IV subunit B [Deltaproteobacteria bacterium]
MSASYTASSISVLEGLEHVRKRPGMYIGGTDRDGLHHLVREIVDNSVDEAINGYASAIRVCLSSDGRTITVEDNGRGIPVDMHPKLKKPALEVILTKLNAGAKFDGGSYITSGGLHGVGSSVVNALSERLVATVKRDGFSWRMQFRRGRTRGTLEKLSAARGTGTTIQFTPDPEIFGDQTFEPDAIREHLEVSAYLNKGLRIVFQDDLSRARHAIQHDGGVVDFLNAQIQDGGAQNSTGQIFLLERESEPRLDVALCWTDAPRERIRTFVNGIPTRQGGTHTQGIKDALAKAIRNYIAVHEAAIPRGVKIAAEDIREGVFAIGSIFLPEPQFQGQTKDKLNNPEVRGQVDSIIRVELERWLQENSSLADAILARIVLAARARQASREATTKVRRKSAVSRRLNLPGKLADCSSSDARRAELFIVEGDSAGGSAKQGRDRTFQAILPLRGKVLNAEQATHRKVMANNELSDIVKALGCGLGKDFSAKHLRYHKIILLMDADSDGHHIATLLLTFLYRYLRPLIDQGHVFLAQPPLFRIDSGKKSWWAADERERDRILKRLPPRARPEISRFKGLGEMMPKTLFTTTMDPRTRRLLRVEVPDGMMLETEQVVSDLMGKDPKTRYREIIRWMDLVHELDI